MVDKPTTTNTFIARRFPQDLPKQHTKKHTWSLKKKVFFIHFMFLSDKESTLETLDIGSTSTFLYFDLFLKTAYATHYVYFPCKP